MIGSLISSAKLISRHQIKSLLLKPRVVFCQDKMNSILFQLKANINKKVNDQKFVVLDESIVSQIQSLKQKDQQRFIKDLINKIGKKQLPTDIISNPQLSELAKKFPYLYTELLSIRIALAEAELLSYEDKDENDSHITKALTVMSSSVSEWTATIRRIEAPMIAFHSSLLLNRTNNYIFENYFSKYLIKDKMEIAYKQVLNWNKHTFTTVRSFIDVIVEQIGQLKKQLAKENKQEIVSTLKSKNGFLFFVIDTFAYNCLCNHNYINTIVKINKDLAAFEKEQKEIQDQMSFIFKYYQILGFTNINYFSLRYIELKRMHMMISLILDPEMIVARNNPNITQQQQLRFVERAYNKIKNLVDGIINDYKQIQNKEDDIEKLSQLSIGIFTFRIEQLERQQNDCNTLEKELRRYKEEILEEIRDQNIRNTIDQKLERGLKGRLKRKKDSETGIKKN